MSKYIPESQSSREELALKLAAALTAAGFSPVSILRTEEAVYERVGPHPTGQVKIRVYTTIVPARGKPLGSIEVRPSGQDAIRVCVVYSSKRLALGSRERGLNSEVRVNRTGEITEIVERTLQRMRESWAWVQKELVTCKHCPAPTFKTKKDRLCCCDLCFKTDQELVEAGERSKPPLNAREFDYFCSICFLHPINSATFQNTFPTAENPRTEDGGKTYSFSLRSPLDKRAFTRFIENQAERTYNGQMAMAMVMV